MEHERSRVPGSTGTAQGPFCKLVEQGTVALAGPFSDNGDLKGVYIFSVGEQETSKLLRDAPMVKAGYLKPEPHPWITGKGVLAPGQPLEP